MNTTLTTADGIQLHLLHAPAGESAHGTAVIVHGLGEHIGRYMHVAAELNRQGWHVVGYDQRGHGRSEGKRGHLNHSDDLLADLAQVIDVARAEHPGPLMLLGHSLGGLIAARLMAEGVGASARAPWSRSVDRLVLSSPAFDAGMSKLQKLQLALLAPLAPHLPVPNGVRLADLSHDTKVVADYIADPLVHDRVTPRLVRFIVDSGELVLQRAPQWNTPTLLMYAGSDRCVAPAGSRAFAAAAPTSCVTSHEFVPLFHEIMNEPQQAEVFAMLGEWLAAAGR